jgi:L-ascorbate metabolism protein UlaG (beta-lactamase superfamily)
MELETLLAKSPVSTAELAPFLDVHFVTHSHSDHFNDKTCKILVEKSKCLFVIPANCVKKAETIGIPQDRIAIAKPREAFDLPNIHVEPLRALHGQKSFSVASYSNNEDCGYVITIAGQKIFQPGDTVLLQEHLDLKGINILFVSPTVHNTYIDRSAILINTIEPDHIFPQHFDAFEPTEETLFWAKGYPDELKAALPKPMQARYHKLPPGQIFCG